MSATTLEVPRLQAFASTISAHLLCESVRWEFQLPNISDFKEAQDVTIQPIGGGDTAAAIFFLHYLKSKVRVLLQYRLTYAVPMTIRMRLFHLLWG